MLRRLAYIENRKVLADSGELTTDITIRDPITMLLVELRAQNGATRNGGDGLVGCIDAIEVIDGSNVLVSMDGYEALSIACYKLGYMPYNLVCESGSLYQNCFFPIFFGRWAGDEQIALDPTKFSNLQVRFKWNLANLATIGATGFLSGTGRLTILADIMEGAAAPGGVLMQKEHYSFVSAASGVGYVDLPTDYPHRSLFIRAQRAGYGQWSGISNVKVTCDQGKFIPLDMRATDFKRWLSIRYPPMHYKHILAIANGETAYFAFKQDETAVFKPSYADSVVTGVTQGIGEQVLTVYTAGSGDATVREVQALVHGWLPHGMAYMPWGEYDDPSSWLDASLFRSIRLELTQNLASAGIYVVVEQAKAY